MTAVAWWLGKMSRNTRNCIVTKGLGRLGEECVTIQPLYRDMRGLAAGEFVSQYPVVYCDQEVHEAGPLCRDLGHDTVMPARDTRPRQGRLACDTAGGPSHDMARACPRHGPCARTWARLCAQAGQVVHLVHPASF